MVRQAVIYFPLLVLGSNASYVPWLEQSEYCVSTCGVVLNKVWFDQKKPLPWPCKGSNAIKSVFYCAAQHCSAKEIQEGFHAANETCARFGMELPSYEAFRSDPKAMPLANVTIISAKDAKKKNFTEPVRPSDEWFDLGYQSTRVRQRSFMFNFSFSFALYGYWILVLLIGSLWRAKTELKTGFQPFLLQPLLIGSIHHMAMTRAEALAITGHIALAFIFCFVGYEDVTGNVYAPIHSQNLAKLIANRLGTVALAHIPLLWVFAARNNPFLWLMRWPYDAFSQFHRWIARMLVVIAVGHAIAYTIVRKQQGTYDQMWSEPYWRYGVAAVAFLCVLVACSASWLRSKAYDLFLPIHIGLAVIIIPMIWMHFRVLDEASAYRGFLWPAVAIWLFDRLLRFIRAVYTGQGRGSTAMISGSQDSELLRVEVTDRLPPGEAPIPGRYYFLYEPRRLRGYESHPFTLCTWPDGDAEFAPRPQSIEKSIEANVHEAVPEGSTSSPTAKSTQQKSQPRFRRTFLIRPQDGFTQHLKDVLSAPSPDTRVEGDESITVSRSLPLLLEGPYGHRPALHGYNSLVLFAGGSGITATISLIYRALHAVDKPRVHLVWVARKRATINDVCSKELRCAIANPRFELDLYLTDDPPRTADLEKTALPTQPRQKQFAGRPETELILQDEVRQVTGKLAVFCCGPPGLEAACRRAFATALVNKGDIKLHIERFGW